MTSSLVTKAGAAGALVAAGGSTVTYLAWDHITLYAVEREVIDKDLKLTVTGPTNTTDKKITIKAPDHTDTSTNPKLSGSSVWSCEITIDDEAAKYISYTNFGNYMQGYFQTTSDSLTDKQKENKRLLVKACAKRRESSSDTSVKGLLAITKGKDSEFKFKDHSYLDFLLEDALYEVEDKVISEEVELTASAEAQNAKLITVKTTDKENVWSSNDEQKHYWECKIIGSETVTNFEANTIQTSLTGAKAQNNPKKSHLVKLCSKNRKLASTGKRVKAELNLPNNVKSEEEWKKYLFGSV